MCNLKLFVYNEYKNIMQQYQNIKSFQETRRNIKL